MQPRRFVTAERSSQKNVYKPSYENLTHSTHSETNLEIPRYGSSTNLLVPPTHPRMKYSDAPRSPSVNESKNHREEYYQSSVAKRKNENVMTNLKSELQNLKLEVSRIMKKGGDNMSLSSRNSDVNSGGEEEVGLKYYGKDVSDTVSVTSEKIINEPLKKLELEYGGDNYDHSHYLELENNLLKTELRNLKNKYNATKQELREKCEALEKKNEYLEISLKRSQNSLQECKNSLEVEMQTIRFQLNRKMQLEIEEDQKRSQPEKDFDASSNNDLLQTKMKSLYEEIGQKSRIINNMNLEFNETKGELEKKTFELKKEIEINGELAKQFEFAKRENSRNQTLLEQEISKKIELTKTIESLRERMNELTKEIQLKDQIVNNCENFESRLSIEIKTYKEEEERVRNENFELQVELRKLRQLNTTNEEEIKHLKLTVSDFTSKIDQLAKNVRMEKEKNMEIEQTYRTLIDEVKENGQRELEKMQREFETFRLSCIENGVEVERNAEKGNAERGRDEGVVREEMGDKDMKIKKWKSEYKLLKMKYEENIKIEDDKKEEMETYYRNFKEYKTKNKVLEMRVKVLETSANSSIEKIQSIESTHLAEKSSFIETINKQRTEAHTLIQKLQMLEIESNELKEAISNEIDRANQEEQYRKEIEQKILTLDVEGNEELNEIIEKLRKRIGEQDEKINKLVKESRSKDSLITKLRQEIREAMEIQEKELENLRSKEIMSIVEELQIKNLASFEEIRAQSKNEIEIHMKNVNDLVEENMKLKSELNEANHQLISLRQEAKSISQLYNSQTSDVQSAREKLETQANEYDLKIDELTKERNSQVKNLTSEILFKNEEIATQRNEIKNLNSTIIGMHRETFDEALRNQIDAAKRLREELNKKNDEVYRIRDYHSLLKAEFDNLKSENDINRLKFISEKKNLQVQFEVEVQQIKNHLTMEQKKVGSLEQKIKLVIDENKKKDAFIQTYIMGKKLPTNEKEIVSAFLKEYEISISGKDINQKLQSESQELEKLTIYNFNLMKQIAEMKEKMLLYEASEADNSELGESICSEDEFSGRRLGKSNNEVVFE